MTVYANGETVFLIKVFQWRIQNFPQVGALNLQGAHIFAKFSPKLHEIEEFGRPSRPLRSTNVFTSVSTSSASSALCHTSTTCGSVVTGTAVTMCVVFVVLRNIAF